MAKALMGTYGMPRSVELLDEVRALRARVAQLEAALAEATAVREHRDEPRLVAVDDPQPASVTA